MNFIYVVLAWDDYYPSPDNSLAFFSKKADAEEFLKTYKEQTDGWEHDHYEIVAKQVN